jgi:hypothetical protein
MSACGIDLSRLTSKQLKKLRHGWQCVFGRFYTMDSTVKRAIEEIDAELERRDAPEVELDYNQNAG